MFATVLRFTAGVATSGISACWLAAGSFLSSGSSHVVLAANLVDAGWALCFALLFAQFNLMCCLDHALQLPRRSLLSDF